MVKKGQNSVQVVIECPRAGLIELYFLNEPPIQTTNSEVRSGPGNVMPSMATLRKSIPHEGQVTQPLDNLIKRTDKRMN